MKNDETISIKRKNLLEAYKKANDEQKVCLENIFGAETFKPRDIRDRVKTFEDAVNELGGNNPLVQMYINLNRHEVTDNDIIAYCKLRIIAAALNEGWQPRFSNHERKWQPYFYVYTQDEIELMNEKNKELVLFRVYNKAFTYGDVSLAYAHYDASDSYAVFGSRLAFKSKELAEYAGKHFINIYAHFLLSDLKTEQ